MAAVLEARQLAAGYHGHPAVRELDLAVEPGEVVALLGPNGAVGRLMKRRAGLLSGGDQQMLTLARALGRRPAVLLIDELSLGLAPIVVARLLDVVRAAATSDGVGVLVVKQHTRQVLKIADQALVLRRGQVALQGSAQELARRMAEVEAVYLSS